MYCRSPGDSCADLRIPNNILISRHFPRLLVVSRNGLINDKHNYCDESHVLGASTHVQSLCAGKALADFRTHTENAQDMRGCQGVSQRGGLLT